MSHRVQTMLIETLWDHRTDHDFEGAGLMAVAIGSETALDSKGMV